MIKEDLIGRELYSDFKAIIEQINSANNIIITSHENPDGDSIGSSLAMLNYIESKGKQGEIYFFNNIPDCYKFLPGSERINIFNDSDANTILNADLIIILDVNSMARIRTVGEVIANATCPKIMIDHHIRPEPIADLTAINSNASATGELMWQLLHIDDEYHFSTEAAINIYTAVLTDTGGFRFSNTSQFAHLIAAEMLLYGIDVSKIYDEIYNQTEHKVVKQLGRTLADSEMYLDGKLHILTVHKQDMIDLDLSAEDLNNFSENTLAVKGAIAGVLISEMRDEDIIKLSFRSKDSINIRQIAEMYGGGGHKNAAGAKVKNMNISDLKQDIINKIAGVL